MTLNGLFSDHMVLQAGKPVRVFGAGHGAASVSFLGETREAALLPDGTWLAELGARPCGGPYELSVTLDGETTVLRDVYVGEVLLCAGQSNMTFTMAEEVTPESGYESDSLLRVFRVRQVLEGEGRVPCEQWIESDAAEVGGWPALPWLIGRGLRRRRDIAVGVVVCAQGASVIQSWMSEEALADERLFVPKDELYIDHSYPDYAAFNPFSKLYHAMFRTITPFTFGHCVWYQGESNASPAESRIYTDLLAAMLACWRGDLRDGLPFIVVQIADTRETEGWPGVQRAQEKAAALPGVTVVRSGDVCERNMIHPVTKGPLAERIADAIERTE